MANETTSQTKSSSQQLNNSTNRPSNKNFQTIIPMTIVKTIMKSSPEITAINQDVLYVVCKATVFIFFSLTIFIRENFLMLKHTRFC
jgi:hypothetical protein